MKRLNNIKKTSFSFVLAITLKSEKKIIKFLNEVKKYLPKNSLIVLFFDTSKDTKTFNECLAFSKKNKNVLVVYDKNTENLADAYYRLYKFCSQLKVQWVISMNAGWRHQPYELIKFINFSNLKDIDCVWGYREKKSNKSNQFRKMISFFGNLLSNLLLNIRIKDLTSGFYMIKGKILERELKKINKFVSKYHYIDTELKYYLKKYSFKQVKIKYKSPNNFLHFKNIFDSVKVLLYLTLKKLNFI